MIYTDNSALRSILRRRYHYIAYFASDYLVFVNFYYKSYVAIKELQQFIKITDYGI